MPLNIDNFGSAIISIIDEIRSNGAEPNNTDNLSARPTESRINAFYRAIGLPALKRVKSAEEKKAGTREEDAFSVGNIFTDVDASNSLINKAKTRDNKYLDLLSEDKQKEFLDSNKNDFLQNLEERDKGSLFPMIVNGDLQIYPQDRRVAGAFYENDLVIDNITYRRPLIELIVLLRLRKDGHIDTGASNKIKRDFKTLSEQGFFNGSSENILTLTILDALKNTLEDPKGIIGDISDTIAKLGEIRTKYKSFFAKDQRNNIVNAQPKVEDTGDDGTLERLEAARINLSRENEAKLALLEFEDIYGKSTKNMRESLMASQIVDIMLADTSAIDKQLNKSKLQKNKATKITKELWKKMDLILGSFSSISSLDIVVVITALFTISQKDLLGLLNEDAIGRLKKMRPGELGDQEQSVTTAIEALEGKVKEIYSDLNDRVKVKNLLEQGRQEET